MRYPGGKGKSFPRLINLMPPHRVYIESHLGSGAVMRNKRPAEISYGIDADPAVIASWRGEQQSLCTLVNEDAIDFLNAYGWEGGELIYADPPYLPELRRRSKVYRHDYTEQQHHDLLKVLTSLKSMVMISGYPGTLYDRVLSGWRKETFSSKTHCDTRLECVWMNFDTPLHLHDNSYLGHTFRERQNVRRRHERLFRKFEEMPATERHHLVEQLATRYGHRSSES